MLRAFNQAFTAFPNDVGFNNGLPAPPEPDFVGGLEMRQFHPFPADELVSGAVLFRDDPFSVALPHVAGEWKGRGKDMDQAEMRSAYDGAALTFTQSQALAYLGNSAGPPGHAEVATFTTDNGTSIGFFAHYAAVPEDGGTLEYHQYPIASTNPAAGGGAGRRHRRSARRRPRALGDGPARVRDSGSGARHGAGVRAAVAAARGRAAAGRDGPCPSRARRHAAARASRSDGGLVRAVPAPVPGQGLRARAAPARRGRPGVPLRRTPPRPFRRVPQRARRTRTRRRPRG
ncbi:hypothetical protein VTK26DRAFT_6039 [Humicola hyalothermophila]